MEADAVNEVQLASQTEQGLHVAVYTYIAFDMHACTVILVPSNLE